MFVLLFVNDGDIFLFCCCFLVFFSFFFLIKTILKKVVILMAIEQLRLYHTLHLCTGFMGEPKGQLNCFEKSTEFDRVPMTRNLPGLCMAVLSLFRTASGLMAPHHTCPKLRKNSCSPVILMPGNLSSSSASGFSRIHFL